MKGDLAQTVEEELTLDRGNSKCKVPKVEICNGMFEEHQERATWLD